MNVIPREGVESNSTSAALAISRVIPREGVESVNDDSRQLFAPVSVIPREGVESYLTESMRLNPGPSM